MADKKDDRKDDRKEGRGFGKGRKDQRKGQKNDKDQWVPVTKLGRLVKYGKIQSLEEIFKFSIPIKESQIVDFFLKDKLKEEVMQLKPVQKMTRAGQRTRFKANVLIGDCESHVGLGQKCHKEVQGAIKGALIDAKLNIIPVRKGYWGNKIGAPHTVPCKVTGKGGSVRIRLIPGPRGSGIVGQPKTKKVLQFAGILDCYTSSRGCTKTTGNCLKAVFASLLETNRFLTPDLWGYTNVEKTPFEQYTHAL
jgi:small subunit ribosomal protein S2e